MHGNTLPAGPFTTPAEYFLFVVPGTSGAFGIETVTLKQLIKEQLYIKMVTSGNADYNIAVFDRQLLLDNCEHIKP